MNRPFAFSAAAATLLLSACTAMQGERAMFSPASLPDTVKVPAGHRVAMETVGVGELTYECREKQQGAGQFEWTFIGPDAVLNDRSGRRVGKYYGPPATWESTDGSKVTGAQLATAPGAPGSIPIQLVKANPAMGKGAMTGVTHIQRLATKGGAAPAIPCDAGSKERRQSVPYQADYIFWSAQ